MSQVIIMPISSDIFISLLYWIVNFGFLSLQLVIAFLLLTATMDVGEISFKK